MNELVRAVAQPLPSDPLRATARFVTERRARQAQIAALRTRLEMERDAIRSLDPLVGQRIDRAF